ncbi:hypothetical protein ABZX12_09110 [Kribbella sp. NPDC003505]|uniref:DUF5110 domain-containing protein n=1 Tax=Kribbella sp. NPDC003505 TaxID=3154448 RepID=UPI0033A8AAD8
MLNSDLNELYTQWLANSAWFDLPIRPHTENLCNCAETSSDSIGDVPSNLANLRQRYELMPPLVYQYQNGPNVREIGHEKLIGKDLLVGVVAGANQRQRDVYLRVGAIIPKMAVDDQTMNAVGKRADGTTRNELVARVYADSTASSFTLAEDDGTTVGYQAGSKRTTDLTPSCRAAPPPSGSRRPPVPVRERRPPGRTSSNWSPTPRRPR